MTPKSLKSFVKDPFHGFLDRLVKEEWQSWNCSQTETDRSICPDSRIFDVFQRSTRIAYDRMNSESRLEICQKSVQDLRVRREVCKLTDKFARSEKLTRPILAIPWNNAR
jgi:hypothetical protein